MLVLVSDWVIVCEQAKQDERQSIIRAVCVDLPGLSVSSDDMEAVGALLYQPTTMSMHAATKLSTLIVSQCHV
jgi:hypothetical protein